MIKHLLAPNSMDETEYCLSNSTKNQQISQAGCTIKVQPKYPQI